MKNFLFPVLVFLLSLSAKATDKDSVVYYNLPDSVKAVQFIADVQVKDFNSKKRFGTGIKTDAVTLSINNFNKRHEISFGSLLPAKNNVMYGLNARWELKSSDILFAYDWKTNETYKLLISLAIDSTENFSLYSGYVFLPGENKWKLIGTMKIKGIRYTIQQPAFFWVARKKYIASVTTDQIWCQRQNGSWKNMKEEILPPPTINLFGHLDSVQQRKIDIKLIEDAIASGKTDAKEIAEGVYFKMMKEGTGRQVSVNDTVTVLYKLTLLNDGSLVNETKTKPDTFSLKRLIRGWQIGVPLCKVGGKIKLVIPSDLAYSIRTRAAKIPPNSILVFEIEVLDAKSPL